VYEYTVTQYDTKTGHGGIFFEYINNFLNLKGEANSYRKGLQNQTNRTCMYRPSGKAKAFAYIKPALSITMQNEDSLNYA
jgi:hypothetical protein